MRERLKNLLAIWLVVKIVLPFTAPLQTCDLADVFGAASGHNGPSLPEASPAAADDAKSVMSPLPASTVRVSTAIATEFRRASRLFTTTFGASLAPQGQQQVVLRV
jgi:hypothetical protein